MTGEAALKETWTGVIKHRHSGRKIPGPIAEFTYPPDYNGEPMPTVSFKFICRCSKKKSCPGGYRCPNHKLEPSPNMTQGRIMIDMVKNGSDLMLVVKDDFRECHYCDKDFQRKGPYSKMCSGCKKVRYCSVDCQKSHWKLHRPFCKLTTWQTIAVRSVV
jgi:hypothetical protein